MATSEPDPLEPLWQKTQEAEAAGDMAGTLFVWKALADKGVWQACARIGEFYETGAGAVPKDPEQALRWYKRAVFEGDDPIAHLGLGRVFYNGTVTAVDYGAALKHFSAAFTKGLPVAAIYLGLMHYRGVAVKMDREEAKRYFHVAKDAGFVAAFAYLGRMALAERRPIQAARLFLNGFIAGVRIARENPSDPRLLGL